MTDVTHSDKNELLQITGNWENQSKELKEKYTQLTDADLLIEAGKEHEMVKKLETRLNLKQEEVIQLIRETQTEKS